MPQEGRGPSGSTISLKTQVLFCIPHCQIKHWSSWLQDGWHSSKHYSPPKAISKDQSKKKHCSSLCLFMRWENFHRALLPPDFPSFARMMSHAHLWTSCWPWKQNYHEWLEIFRVHTPYSVRWRRGTVFLKGHGHRISNKTRSWMMNKKRKVAIR